MFFTPKVAEVVGAIDRGEPVVWDKVPEDDIVKWDVAMDDVNDDVDRGPIVEEDVEDGAGEEIVVDMDVASVWVQSKTNTGRLISVNQYIQRKNQFHVLKRKNHELKAK